MNPPGPRALPPLERFMRYVSPEPNSGCWLWCGAVRKDGYGVAGTGSRLDGSRRIPAAHRFSWELYRGPIPVGQWVLHKCDVKVCVNPDHLFLGTHQQNMTDMVSKGRGTLGERNARTKLTVEAVQAIRIDDRKHPVIAATYGVSRANIGLIKRYARWRHV